MDDNLNDWKKKRKDYLVVGIFCFIVGTYFFMKVKSESYIIKPSDLIVYENLITTDKPKFKETKGKHKRKWIEFKCVNNKTTFEIASFDYSCVNDDEIINEINNGDTISVKILKNDMGNFDTETSCEIHSLAKKNKEYLDIECRNEEDTKAGEKWYLILYSITIMTSTVYSFTQKPKFSDKVDPQVLILIVILILFYVLR
jgi:hypothetical protein